MRAYRGGYAVRLAFSAASSSFRAAKSRSSATESSAAESLVTRASVPGAAVTGYGAVSAVRVPLPATA